MRLWRFLLPLALLGAALFAGCGGDGKDNPFEGDWLSMDAGSLSFDGSTWKDGEGDSGEYTFSGEYPIYTITFESGAGAFDARATFADTRTFELCRIAASGALVDCNDFVLNKPTIH